MNMKVLDNVKWKNLAKKVLNDIGTILVAFSTASFQFNIVEVENSMQNSEDARTRKSTLKSMPKTKRTLRWVGRWMRRKG